MRNKSRVGVIFLVFVAGFIVSLLFVRIWGNSVSAQDDPYEGLKTFTEVLSSIQKNYVEPVKTKDLINGAINGLVTTLDPHSSFMPPDVYQESQIDTKGEFGGLGLQVGAKDGRVVVIAPIEGTPADRAGILAGDVITKVDDKLLKKDIGLMDAVHRMRGPKGTKVVLTIEREHEEKPLTFQLVRETIFVQSVKHKVLDKEIGYVRITQFQEQTARDLVNALEKLKESNVHSLILDLRNNPGGLLTSSVDVSKLFLDNGALIVSVKPREGKKDEYLGHGGGLWKDIPMVVLVNKGSASASEIVSGAFQDWGRAVVLGTQTFGKGSVQTILPLSDGSALRLTTAKYYTPKGRSIHGEGITPDIIVAIEPPVKASETANPSKTDKDSAAPKIEEKSKKEEDHPKEVGSESELNDIQLQKAIDLLKGYKIFKRVGDPLSQTAVVPPSK
ncbi:MAG: S41 family peptidase [Nitrospirota bacterium]